MENLPPIFLEYWQLIAILFLITCFSMYLQGIKWFHPIAMIVTFTIGATLVVVGLIFGGLSCLGYIFTIEVNEIKNIYLIASIAAGVILMFIANLIKPPKD